MTEKRDLKADLGLLKNSFYPSGVELIETAEHAIERAMEAKVDFKNQEDYSDMLESERNELYHLVRELVGVIDELRRQINECGLDGEMWDVYQKAKEVLGDE